MTEPPHSKPRRLEDPIERAVLRDGSTIHIRPIEAGDRDRLGRAFERLSAESRYRRFFGPIDHLDESELRYFTELDHVDHEALVAIEPDHGELVGVARYVRLGQERPETAEVAVAVTDDWQGRGVATTLLHELVWRAQKAGVRQFCATCQAENREAIDVLKGLGRTSVGHPDHGLAELTIALPRGPSEPAPVHHALKHAAAGTLAVKPGGALRA